MLVVLGFAGAASAQTYYSITGGGGQAQIGDGLPLPIQVNRTMSGGAIGTMTMFPPLLIPINPDPAHALVKQTGSAPAQMKVPPGVFKVQPAIPKTIGLANNNPKVFQVRTRITFSGPASKALLTDPAMKALIPAGAGTMTFKKDGWRTATAVTFMGAPAGANALYSGSTNRFGGASQTRVVPATPIGVWARPPTNMLPCKHKAFNGGISTVNSAACAAPLLPALPRQLAAAGGGKATTMGKITKGVTIITPGTPKVMSPGTVVVSVPNTTGLIAKQIGVSKLGGGMTGALTNKATSVGFPWTTGMIALSAKGVTGLPEKFTITGMDSRTGMGAGTISLVAGALSNRTLSKANANKSWARYTLPEPAPAVGAAAALIALGVCHGLVRRRSR